MKWRLLEGGGQAYYELGVADSGALIGLSRSDLEQSLETLEEMAGEIGASVIVVKEIEVPPAMAAFADRVSAYIDPETGAWTEKMSNKRYRHTVRGAKFGSTETETDTTDYTDLDDGVATPSSLPDTARIPYTHRLTTNPERPTAQSSPYIAPLDDDLALFSMEPEPDMSDDDADDEGTPEPVLEPSFTVDIEIAAVYKPRPFRRRTPPAPHPGTIGSKSGRRIPKKPQPWHKQSPPTPVVLDGQGLVPNKQEAKALHRRLARDRRREEKRNALVAHAEQAVDDFDADKAAGDAHFDADAVTLATGLKDLHVSVQSTAAIVDGEQPSANGDEEKVEKCGGVSLEPRLIVEALVVRKLSIDEAFLDFGGFSLT